MMENAYHVYQRPNGRWSVRKYGAVRAARNFGNRSGAMAFGKKMARAQAGKLFVHQRNGRIESLLEFTTGH